MHRVAASFHLGGHVRDSFGGEPFPHDNYHRLRTCGGRGVDGEVHDPFGLRHLGIKSRCLERARKRRAASEVRPRTCAKRAGGELVIGG
jgi:hypothetical protein